MPSVLKQIEDNIQNEITIRQGGCGPDRKRFIELKFNSPKEMEAGKRIFNALLRMHTTSMFADFAHDAQQGKFKIEGVNEDVNSLTIKYGMFGEIPLRSLLANIGMLKAAMLTKEEDWSTLTIQGSNSTFVPVFATPRSLDSSLSIYSALAELHSPGTFSSASLFTASEGLGQPVGNFPGNTPAILIEENIYKKVVAAEQGEQQDRGQQPRR